MNETNFIIRKSDTFDQNNLALDCLFILIVLFVLTTILSISKTKNKKMKYLDKNKQILLLVFIDNIMYINFRHITLWYQFLCTLNLKYRILTQ